MNIKENIKQMMEEKQLGWFGYVLLMDKRDFRNLYLGGILKLGEKRGTLR